MSKTPLFDERKAAEAAAFLLFKAGGKLPLIKLVKLLYLAERLSLRRHGEPLTGDRLVSMPNGPVLSMTYDHINGALPSRTGGWDSWIADRAGHEVALADASKLRSPEQDLLRLSDSDLEVLADVWAEFGHWDRWKLVEYTHSDACPEWEDPEGSSQPISYERLFEKLGFSVEQAAALVERIDTQRVLNASMN
jgi:uncharacterized phage-associated protein